MRMLVSKGSTEHLFSHRGARYQCPICSKAQAIRNMSSGEVICSGCGYVEEVESSPASSSREREPEIRSRSSRLGLAMHDMGLSTVIGNEQTHPTGNRLSVSTRIAMHNLRRCDTRIKYDSTIDRNFRVAFSELDKLAAKLSLNISTVQRAAYIYGKAFKKGLLGGARPISEMIAAAVYAACRESATQRTLGDISDALGCSRGETNSDRRRRRKGIARYYRLLLTAFDIRMPVPQPTKCVSRIASAVGISEKTQRKALEILKCSDETGHSAGKDRMGLAAAALYVACKRVARERHRGRLQRLLV